MSSSWSRTSTAHDQDGNKQHEQKVSELFNDWQNSISYSLREGLALNKSVAAELNMSVQPMDLNSDETKGIMS